MRKLNLVVILIVLALATGSTAGAVSQPIEARAAAVCADFPNQAAAQAAANTVDADGDGIYCESLPCPCSTGSAPSATPTPAPVLPPPPTPTPTPTPSPTPTPTPTPSEDAAPTADESDPAGCTRPRAVQRISFSKTKYRHIRRHYLAAVRKGWPKILVVNRPGAAERRERLLQTKPIRVGYDRDEYPPAIGRGRGRGLVRGTNPRGWRADVAYVGSSENRSHGARLGVKLRRFCSGTKFRYVFY